MIHQVEKPIERSRLRRLLGREYYILRRKIKWHFSDVNYATTDDSVTAPYIWKEHRSVLLRKLKDVDMHLQYNKIENLRIAISNIDGVVIKPGEVFSVWRMVGRPTKRKGYKMGMMIHNGHVSTGIGGGLCQLGNLLYWMALHTPLTIKERWRHSFDVFPDVNRTIPFACGATLAYNYIDLQLENTTDITFKINLWIDDEYLNGVVYGSRKPMVEYEIIEKDHRIELQWWGDYTRHNRIMRRIIDIETGTSTEEFVTENNAIMMYNPILPHQEHAFAHS